VSCAERSDRVGHACCGEAHPTITARSTICSESARSRSRYVQRYDINRYDVDISLRNSTTREKTCASDGTWSTELQAVRF